MALSAGTRLGPYEILAPLGAGGMGEVYRARDPRLKRDVALKVLPAELASEPERLKRFEREAQSLAALSHPHIVTIFTVEEAEGLHFLTMELVEGKTLTKVIPRGGLSLPHFFRIAIPLTEAVSAAHEKGITHRDLKPGNVMVTEEDRVKVLDFGLAKLRYEAEAIEDSEAPTVPATDVGRVMGTAPYMSPEQVQGRVVDHRSDVFSLGIVLYEMLTGDRPFQGDTSAELASSILRDTPASVTERKADLPRDLGRLIRHCLEKEPRKRFQSTLDLANDLEELRREVDTGEALVSTGAPITARRVNGKRRAGLVGGAVVVALALAVGYLQTRSPPEPPPEETASAARKMLVVRPFENLGAPEEAYFAAGMTEEITSRLARVSGLGVISRSSAIRYEGTDKTTAQIGEELAVDFVLEGTVRWDRRSEGTGRVRITPQLIRVTDDTHVWADNYDRVLDDIFETQSEIAQAVVEQLGVALLPEERQSVEARPTESQEAYGAYLKGQYHLERLTSEGRQMGLQYLEQAIEIDPKYASAYAGLAGYYLDLSVFGELAPKEAAPQARDAALKALELDDSLASAHGALGGVNLHYEWDWTAAEKASQRALSLNPSDAGAHNLYAHYLTAMGRYEEAVDEARKAQQLDPLSLTLTLHVGWHLYWARRYDEAMEQLVRTIELDPSWWDGHYHLGQVYEQKGMLEEAIAELEEALSLDRGPVTLAGLGHAYGLAGRVNKARRIALELEEESKRRYIPAYQIAAVYAGLGDRDQAFACLERAYDERDWWLTYIAREPMFDPVRSDPRFQDLLRRMGFPE